MQNIIFVTGKFLSTLSLRRATRAENHANSQQEFLSTLSLRRATSASDSLSDTSDVISIHALLAESDNKISAVSITRENFYPRSPCGERQWHHHARPIASTISIHALLAESDAADISTRREASISIHALLAESDLFLIGQYLVSSNFYPRSPCGERQIPNQRKIDQKNFYPRSPCGERPRA